MNPGSRPSTNLTPRQLAGVAAGLALALAVRIGLLPALSRHGWEGHEAEYLAVFEGSWQGGWSTRVVPLLGWLYRGLGSITQAPGVLVALAVLFSMASIAALVLLVRRQAGAGAALLAGTLVALYGNHAFWSSSAYNVMLPHALLMGALLLASIGGWSTAVVSGLLLGAAAGTRPELVVFALPALLLLRRHSLVQRGAWLGSAALVFTALLLPMSQAGAHPAGLMEEAPAALGLNLGLLTFLAPFSHPTTLGLALVLAAVVVWRHPTAGLLWLSLAVVGHVSAAGFADSGYRQALMCGVALCTLQAMGIAVLWRLGGQRKGAARWLARTAAGAGLVAVVLVASLDCVEVGRRYYADPGLMIAELSAANPAPITSQDLSGCIELIDTPARAEGEPSPFEPLDWSRCWIWVEDHQHRRWTSLGVHDRAARMRALFDLEPMGMLQDPSGGGQPPRQVWRVLGAR